MGSKSKVESKKSKDKELKAQVMQLTEDLKRSHADFLNYRRRSEEEQSQIMTIAKKEVASKFLPVLDDVQRAMEHLPAKSANDPLGRGYKMLSSHLEQAFKQLGVEEIPAKGAEFDPQIHEAVDYQDGRGDREVVTEVLKRGYKIGSLVLRPAVVKVGKVTSKSNKEDK